MHMRTLLRVLLLGVLVLTPFAGASTYEAWTDGLYDADFDNDVLAAISLQSVVENASLISSGYVDVIVAVVSPGDDVAADLVDPSPHTARAPPTS